MAETLKLPGGEENVITNIGALDLDAKRGCVVEIWKVHFLKDRTAFWKEGTDMGHCLGRRGGPTLGVDKLFGSVYFEGKHIGTALYAGHADRWELSEAHGKFNQPLAAQALRALHKLAERIRLPDYRRRGR